jgi:integrase
VGLEKQGSVKFKKGAWEASLAHEYLGRKPTEAEAWALVRAAQKLDGGGGRNTLEVFGTEWIAAREVAAIRRGKGRAALTEASRWREHIESADFYRKALRSISAKDVQQWIRAMYGKTAVQITMTGSIGKKVARRTQTDRPLGRQTIANAKSLLELCFDDAMIEGLMSSNPARLAKLERRAVSDDEGELVEHLTEEQVARLFSNPKLPARERCAFAIGIYGGLRLGELLGLRWSDVLDERRIQVRRAYDKTVKSNGSRRDVPQLPPVTAALKAYRESLRVRPIGEALLFPTRDGSCHGPSFTFGWADKRYRKKGILHTKRGWASELGVEYSFHTLRHTCGCHLLMGTWRAWVGELELKHVSSWLGHSSEEVTRKHYAQFSRDALTNRVAKLKAVAKDDASTRKGDRS